MNKINIHINSDTELWLNSNNQLRTTCAKSFINRPPHTHINAVYFQWAQIQVCKMTKKSKETCHCL